MHSIAINLVLADFMDLLQGAVPIIFMILYGVAQLVGSGEGKPNRKPPAPKPKPAPPELIGVGPRPAGNLAGQPGLEEKLRREVDEFLRRAQGAKPQPVPIKQPPRELRQRPADVAPPAQRRPVVKQSSRPTSMPRSVETPRPTAAPLAAPAASTLAPLGSTLAQQVAQHLGGTAALAEHAQHLGADVALADERLSQHLQQKFMHQVGSLTPQTAVVDRRSGESSPLAKEMLSLLARPGGVQQMIVAGEILRRPADRWL